jgi:hypothetical protein
MIKFRVTELLERTKGYAEFVEAMVKESLADLRRPPPRIPTTEQQPSTVAALASQALRDPRDDEAWSMRPIPQNYLANPNSSDLDELTGKRDLSVDDLIHGQSVRNARYTFGESVLLGETSKEAKRRAADAFVYSKPAELTPEEIKKVTKLTLIESTPLEPVKEKPIGWFKRIFGGGEWM